MPEASTTPYNTISHLFDLRSFSDLCGPGELADVLIEYRQKAPGGYVTHLTNDQVRRLIKLAYVGSHRPEEGRFPVFRLFAHKFEGTNDQLRTVLRFEAPHLLDSESLRKLAPTFSSPALALQIDGGDGTDLLASALIQVSPAVGTPPGHPEYWTQDASPWGLMLKVEGPGQLRVSEGDATLRLRGGRITELSSFTSVPAVGVWLRELADWLASEIAIRDGRADERFGGASGGMRNLLSALWSQVLRDVIAARHGGAIVLVPPAGAEFVRLRYRTEGFALRGLIEDFWLAAIQAVDSQDPRDLDKMRVDRDRLRETASALPQLANVDGCVLMTRQLDLLGFGGEIKIPEGAPQTGLFDAATGEPRDGVSDEQFGGTRHRSALRFAKATADSLVFVVSQDGDLRVFSNHSDQVHAFGGLEAWISQADGT